MSQYSYPNSSPPRRGYQPEKEKSKIMLEKEEIITRFLQSVILDETGKYRTNIRSKTYKDGSKYEGELNLQDSKHGRGIFYYQNGDRYIGEWQNDLFNGKGVYIFSMGERYEGNLINGQKEGKGYYIFQDK